MGKGARKSDGKIGEKDVQDLKPKVRDDGTRTDGYLWDKKLPGFGVKATPAGKKVFIVQYRLGGRAGKTERVTIGAYGPVTLTEARERAKELLGKVAAKESPAEELRKSKQKAGADTLRQAIERYLDQNQPKGRYGIHKRARLLGDDMKPLLDKPVGSIKRGDILTVLDKVKARSENAARLLLVDLRPFFKWAVARDLIEATPITGIEPPKPAEERERVLEPYEVAAFWKACEGVSWPFASVFKLLLLTGARRDEVAGITWNELNPNADVWELAKSRTKNGKGHWLPLTATALALVNRDAADAAKRASGFPTASELVFSTTGITPPSGWSKAKRALDSRMQAVLKDRFKPWRLHDLRRTCATGMENEGIATVIVETALNHKSGVKRGIVRVYQRADHKEAVRRAFSLWEQRVLAIVSGDDAGNGAKVITFTKAASM